MTVSVAMNSILKSSSSIGWKQARCMVVHCHEDGIDRYADRCVIDFRSEQLRIHLPAFAGHVAVFQVRVLAVNRIWFPRVRSLLAVLFRSPFPVGRRDLACRGKWLRIRLSGYVDTTFSLRLDSEAENVYNALLSGKT